MPVSGDCTDGHDNWLSGSGTGPRTGSSRQTVRGLAEPDPPLWTVPPTPVPTPWGPSPTPPAGAVGPEDGGPGEHRDPGDHSGYEDDGAGGGTPGVPGGELLPVLPLGTGLALVGLGMAVLGLRLRRR